MNLSTTGKSYHTQSAPMNGLGAVYTSGWMHICSVEVCMEMSVTSAQLHWMQSTEHAKIFSWNISMDIRNLCKDHACTASIYTQSTSCIHRHIFLEWRTTKEQVATLFRGRTICMFLYYVNPVFTSLQLKEIFNVKAFVWSNNCHNYWFVTGIQLTWSKVSSRGRWDPFPATTAPPLDTTLGTRRTQFRARTVRRCWGSKPPAPHHILKPELSHCPSLGGTCCRIHDDIPWRMDELLGSLCLRFLHFL